VPSLHLDAPPVPEDLVMPDPDTYRTFFYDRQIRFPRDGLALMTTLNIHATREGPTRLWSATSKENGQCVG
jgi:hypothetical protein